MLYQPRIANVTNKTALVLVLVLVCGVNVFAADSRESLTTTEPATAVQDQQPAQTPAPAPLVQEGRNYGQPGFVGEPINLNVVNADIRDILNYIRNSMA